MDRRDVIAAEAEARESRFDGAGWAGGVAPADDDDQEIWLLSYSDMVTLLFSVFVMLTAITAVKDRLPPSDPEPTERTEATAEIEAPPPFVVPPSAPPSAPSPTPGETAASEPPAAPEGEPPVIGWLRRLAEVGGPLGVTVRVRLDRIGVDIGETILFSPGRAELSPAGRRVLERLAPALAAIPGEILVEGHTDSTPLGRGARFPSNWELSAARAAVAARALIAAGLPPQRFAAVGYADTRPLTERSDADGLALNRRVTLTLRAPPGASGLPPR